MDAILTAVSSVVTALVGWVGQFATAITASPILLLAFIVPLVFLGINAVRKLLNV